MLVMLSLGLVLLIFFVTGRCVADRFINGPSAAEDHLSLVSGQLMVMLSLVAVLLVALSLVAVLLVALSLVAMGSVNHNLLVIHEIHEDISIGLK